MEFSEVVFIGFLVCLVISGVYVAAMNNHPLVGMDEPNDD